MEEAGTGGCFSVILLLVPVAEGPLADTIAARGPAGPEPHLPVQDTGQERVLFC